MPCRLPQWRNNLRLDEHAVALCGARSPAFRGRTVEPDVRHERCAAGSPIALPPTRRLLSGQDARDRRLRRRRAIATTPSADWSGATSASTCRAIRPSSFGPCRALAGSWSANHLYNRRRAQTAPSSACSTSRSSRRNCSVPGSVKADVRKMNWIGRVISNNAGLYSWHAATVKRIEDSYTQGADRLFQRSRVADSLDDVEEPCRREVQADHRPQGCDRGTAGHGARRGRRRQHAVDGVSCDPGRLAAGQEGQRAAADRNSTRRPICRTCRA